MKNTISVILATYNERENIALIVEKVSEFLSDRQFEIVIVDDDSPDKTWEVAEQIADQDKRVRVFRRLDERGLTSAYNLGIRAATGETLIWLDADLQHPVELIPMLANMVDEGLDAALTSRYLVDQITRTSPNSSSSLIIRMQMYLTRILNRFTSRYFDLGITDWTSGYLAIRRDLFEQYELSGDHGAYYIHLMLYLTMNKFRFKEVPYILQTRQYGKSKTTASFWALIWNGTKYLAMLVRIWRIQKAQIKQPVSRGVK